MTTDEAGRQLMNSLAQFRKLHLKNKPQHGLHPSEKHMLFIIKELTENCTEGIKVTEISSALHVSPPTVTQKITSLEKKGFVRRAHSKKDRRKVFITISDNAKVLMESMEYEYLMQCKGLAEYLGVEQSENLNMLLNKTYYFFDNYNNKKENFKE